MLNTEVPKSKILSNKLISFVWIAIFIAITFKTIRALPEDVLKFGTVNYPIAALGIFSGIVFSLPMVWILRDYLLVNQCHSWSIAFVVSYLPAFAKYIPGKVWSFLGFMVQAKELAHISGKDAFIFQIYLQMIGILSSLVLTLTGAALGNWYGQEQVWSRINTGVMVLSVIGIGGIIALIKIARKYGHSVKKHRIRYHLMALSFQKIFRGISLVIFLNAFIPVQGHSLEIMLSFIIAVQMGLLAVFSPAGIGVTEGAYVILLSGSYPLSTAIKIAMLARIWQMAIDISSSGLGLVIKSAIKNVCHQVPVES